MMRVGLLAPVTHRVPPVAYGPWEQVVADLAMGLTRLGHDVIVFAAGGSDIQTKLVAPVPYPLEEWQGEEPADPRIWEEIHIAEMVDHAASGELDVIHNHLSVHPLGYSSVIGVPIVTTLHGVGWNRATHPALKRYRHLPYVSISDSERHFFPDLNYVATIHNGIDPDRFPEGPGGGGYLLYAGRLAPEKAPQLAVETALAVGMTLRMAGPIEDKHREFYESSIASRVDGVRVEYLGELTGLELAALYREAEALIVPLEWDEPFGLVVAEAMMSGTPVIGWRRGALPELVCDGVTGFLVADVAEAVDAVSRLETIDRSECRAWAVEHLGLDRMARDYESIYELLVSGVTMV